MGTHDPTGPFARQVDAAAIDSASLPVAPHQVDEEGDEPFHLPVLGLYADLEVGSGAVHLPDEFLHADPAVQRRILSDWQRGLAEIQARLD